MTVDPPQSAEIDLFDDEDLAAAAAAAAMSTILLDEGALALEAALVRLGAMAFLRCVRGCNAQEGNEREGEEEFWGERDK